MLSSELKMLQSYKIDAELLYEDYRSEFYSDMSFIESKLSPQEKNEEAVPPESPPDIDTLKIDPSSKDQRWRKTDEGWEREDSPEEDTPSAEDPSKPAAPSWAKKLYKKIALVAHPDRTLEKDNKKRLNKIFTDSAGAMSTGDFNKLLGYALDLGIDLQDADVDHVPLITSRIESVKQELKAIEESLEWLWGESLGVSNLRKAVATTYLRKKGIDVNTDELVSIIKEMENDNAAGSDS